jgi:vesicle coat complex subunit
MEDKKKISILAILGLILGGGFLYIIFSDMTNIEEEEVAPAQRKEEQKKEETKVSEEASSFESRTISLAVWPDAASINADTKTFSATVLPESNDETFEIGQEIDIRTDGATKFYKVVNKTPSTGDYFDFAQFQTLMESWEGPNWKFTLKGATQSDGSILASEIFYQIQ